MFNFKSVSWRISFTISVTVIIVGAIIAAYMQSRIITETDNGSRLSIKRELSVSAGETDLEFTDLIYGLRDVIVCAHIQVKQTLNLPI